jgi:hypothetical protein
VREVARYREERDPNMEFADEKTSEAAFHVAAEV